MPGLAQKEISQLLKHVEQQGVTYKLTTDGYMLKLPNGEQTVLHKTNSDWRSTANLRARLRAAGVTWPSEEQGKDGLPVYITRGTVTEHEMQRYREHLGEPLPERVVLAELSRGLYGDDRNVMKQIYRVLYRLGYMPAERGVWAQTGVLPEPSEKPTRALRAVEDDATQYPEITKAVEQSVVEQPGREFLDTVDSWVLQDIDGLKAIPLGALGALLSSTGLDYEIRVWRKS